MWCSWLSLDLAKVRTWVQIPASALFFLTDLTLKTVFADYIYIQTYKYNKLTKMFD